MRLFTSKIFFSVLICYLAQALCEKGAILFLCSRTNYAWGYTHEGWFIDSSGAIRDYSFTKSDSVRYVELNNNLPSRIYDKILTKSVLIGKSVHIDTLLFMQDLIEPARNGIATFIGRCFDAGMIRYSAINYNVCDSCQKEVICYQAGDMGACNSAFAARRIARWLTSIDSLDLQFCAPPDSCLNITTSVTREGSLIQNNPLPMVMDGHTIRTNISHNGGIAIRVYTLRGELVAPPFKRYLAKGRHQFTLTDMLSGIQSKKPVIVEISTGGAISAVQTVIISQNR